MRLLKRFCVDFSRFTANSSNHSQHISCEIVDEPLGALGIFGQFFVKFLTRFLAKFLIEFLEDAILDLFQKC